ncbi:ATP-dependent DNA helicase [Verticiella sediminum]|nr:ATP-dependent DNA helicase [Verticiella sediminum]
MSPPDDEEAGERRAAAVRRIAALFATDGPLAQRLPGFRARSQQTEMALAVAETLADGGTLVAEAGTGTGKTYAYLAPALLRGGKVLVSTATKTLQDQIFSRDLPQLVAAMQMPAAIALLKGRGNYLCHLHLERTEADPRALASREEVVHLGHIRKFAKRTRTGDIAELAEVPDNASIWGKVTSTRDNCLGTECGFYRDCHVVKARKAAMEAEVVVVNHALFLADLALRGEGIAELLPRADCVIFDEAHQLPTVATRFLGESVSTHQMLELARDSLNTGLAQARESADWVALAQPLEQAARELRLACAAIERMPGQKSAFEALPDPEAFDAAILAALEAAGTLGKVVAAVRERHPDFELLARRAAELFGRLLRWAPEAQPVPPAPPAVEGPSAWDDDGAGDALDGDSADERTAAHHDAEQLSLPGAPVRRKPRAAAADSEDDADWVRWIETTTHHVRLQAAPLSVAKAFSRHRPEGQAWILTSATLAVRTDFSHFTRQLGLWEARTGQWESPFDYPNCGMLFVPQGIPAPDRPEFTQAFVDTLVPLIEANQGSALILCTTLRAVDTVHRLLSAVFAERGWKWPLLRQGERTRRELLETLRTGNHAVLVGSASFWEGIDVPGDALTLVAIDKLPFAPPDDPVIDARIKESRKRGGNPFFEFQLPQAAIALKQGAGRLIRRESDWGVLMVADRRLVEKPYGKLLWRGLPPFARSRNREDVVAFLRERRGR